MKEKTPPDTPTATAFSPANYATVSAAAGVIFFALAVWIARQGTNVPEIDRQIHNWVMSHRTHGNIKIARAITWGGVTTIALPLLIVVGVLATEGGRRLTRRLRSGFIITVLASVGVLLGLTINRLDGRVRPPVADWAGSAGGPSFPSGHTTVASLFAASCAWVIATRVRSGWPRRSIWIGAAVYALLVGLSRIWLGVHWPTDVLGGWLYASTWLAASAALVLLVRQRRTSRQAKVAAALKI